MGWITQCHPLHFLKQIQFPGLDYAVSPPVTFPKIFSLSTTIMAIYTDKELEVERPRCIQRPHWPVGMLGRVFCRLQHAERYCRRIRQPVFSEDSATKTVHDLLWTKASDLKRDLARAKAYQPARKKPCERPWFE